MSCLFSSCCSVAGWVDQGFCVVASGVNRATCKAFSGSTLGASDTPDAIVAGGDGGALSSTGILLVSIGAALVMGVIFSIYIYRFSRQSKNPALSTTQASTELTGI
jgi:hypothetical protein